ncbi:MAG TPA: hypothetical protein VI233_07410 [Puia sp.]
MNRLFYLVISSIISSAAFAQDSTTHFSIAATYNSGLNYYGRVDSLHSKGFYPSVGLTLKNGLYATSTFVFIQNSLTRQYAATLVEGGYNFNNKKNTWAGSLSVSKFFYQADVSLVQSAIKEVASFSLTHLNKVVNITAAANVKFSGYTDIGVQAGLDHIIKFPEVLGGVIVLDPSANIFAGTQNFTKTEYQKKNFLLIPVGEETITTNSKRFDILSYEFSMPVIYGYKKLNFILTPSYVLPQNLLTIPGQPGASERGAPLFYFTATTKLTL